MDPLCIWIDLVEQTDIPLPELVLTRIHAEYQNRFNKQVIDPSVIPSDNNPSGYDLTFLAEGSLLMSLVDLPGFTAKRNEYRDYLLRTQEDPGTWDGFDPQMTAYIVKGLIAIGDPIANADSPRSKFPVSEKLASALTETSLKPSRGA